MVAISFNVVLLPPATTPNVKGTQEFVYFHVGPTVESRVCGHLIAWNDLIIFLVILFLRRLVVIRCFEHVYKTF